MRRLVLFVVPILIVVTVGFAVFGVLQARLVEDRLLEEAKRKTKVVAGRLEARERPRGCIMADDKGKTVAVTKRFAGRKDVDRPRASSRSFPP